MIDSPNPYQSPRAEDAHKTVRLRAPHSGARGRLARGGLLYRKVVVEAPVATTIEFNGRGLHDTVYVEGQIVARKFSWWRIAPRLEFEIQAGDETLPVTVSLRLGRGLAIRGFQVQVAGAVVYREGSL